MNELMLGFVHKHNNFLTITQGYTDLLLSEVKDKSVSQSLETIAKSARNAVDLNARLIACANADSPNLKEVSLNDFLRDRQARYLQKAQERGLLLTLTLSPDETAAAQMDPLWLDLILDEIVNNACEVDACSEVTIELKKEESFMIEVRNNGMEITAEVLPQIFTPFYSTKNQTHLGIGLTRAGCIAGKMGVHISISSTAGTTTAKLTLP